MIPHLLSPQSMNPLYNSLCTSWQNFQINANLDDCFNITKQILQAPDSFFSLIIFYFPFFHFLSETSS